MDQRTIVLDARLQALAWQVGVCENYADIGCDHGRLGAWLLSTNRVRRAVLTDISADSLKKARWLIDRIGLNDRVDFRVGDGALALETAPEAAVIAGMGGATIAAIIRQGRERLGGARLVLQPNVAAPELRRALVACGYRITDEQIVAEGRRHYVVIAAAPGRAAYDERQLTVGPVLLEKLPPTLAPYADFRLRVARKALAGAVRGADAEQAALLRREIEIWEAVRACL